MSSYADVFDTEIDQDVSVNSGAFAVVDSNIEMKLDRLGIYRPVVKDKSVERSPQNDVLSQVSIMSDTSPNEDQLASELFGHVSGIRHDPTIGYYLNLYGGHVTEGTYRERGSSGGMGTWICVQLLQRGLIDGVIHLKPSPIGDPILFRYAISHTAEEILQGSKSRYFPGEFSTVLNEVKTRQERYAITGIPSFVAELRLLAKADPQINQAIAYTIGLICGHQKSANYSAALAWEHGIAPEDLESIDFRSKNPSGRASQYMTELRGQIDGKVVDISRSQLEFLVSNWGHCFFKPRFSDFTDDAFNETADIALGDAWIPEYDKDGMGNNIVVVRHPLIAQIIDDGIHSHALALDELPVGTVIQSQKGLLHHTRDEIGYRLAREEKRGNWYPKMRIPPSDNLPYLRKKVQDVREKISRRSHIAFAEAIDTNDWNAFARSMRPLVLEYRFWYLLILLTGKSRGRVLLALKNRIQTRFQRLSQR